MQFKDSEMGKEYEKWIGLSEEEKEKRLEDVKKNSRKVHHYPVKVTCIDCNQEIAGMMDVQLMTIVDTPGFTIFNEGITCDACLMKKGCRDPNTRIDDMPSRKESLYGLRRF